MCTRDVIRALLNKQIPDRVGIHEHFWPFIIENAWGAQGVPKGCDFVSRYNLDIRNVSWFAAPGPRKDNEKIVEETEECIVRQDAWGASQKTWKSKAGTPEHVGFSLTSPGIWYDDYREAFESLDLRSVVNFEEIKAKYSEAMAGDEFVTYSSLFVFEDLRRRYGV